MQRLFDTSDLLVGKKPGTYPTPAPYLDDMHTRSSVHVLLWHVLSILKPGSS